MFGIYFRLVLVIFCYKRGGEKCKIDVRGYQPMHICDVSKPLANVWNIFQASPGDFPVTRGGGEM